MRALAALVLGLALVSLPVRAAQAAACTWQKTAWALPSGTSTGVIHGYDGSRYAVGVTGTFRWPGITNQRGTLWDNGKVALRLTGETPHLRDVNAAGLIVGEDVVGDAFAAVTVGKDGTTTALPRAADWTSSSAWLVNNAGDVVGFAGDGGRDIVVVWPASAPGTYRELPTPDVGFLSLTDVDEQGRIIAQTDSGSGGGFVWDTDGQWRVLAAQGAGGYGTPQAVRGGRVVGGLASATGYAAAEWNARGGLVRTIGNGAIDAVAIGGNGTVGGHAYVSSVRHAVLWRNGTVSDPLTAVPSGFSLDGISDDERTLVGVEGGVPGQYRCA